MCNILRKPIENVVGAKKEVWRPFQQEVGTFLRASHGERSGVGRFPRVQARRRQGWKTWEVSLSKATNATYKRLRGRKEEDLCLSETRGMLWESWRKNDDSCNKGCIL